VIATARRLDVRGWDLSGRRSDIHGSSDARRIVAIERDTPWPVWAAVTLLVALIGAFGKTVVDRPPESAPHTAASQPATSSCEIRLDVTPADSPARHATARKP
jgi:hypothetical protein